MGTTETLRMNRFIIFKPKDLSVSEYSFLIASMLIYSDGLVVQL